MALVIGFAPAATAEKKKVLYVNSYHFERTWSKAQILGCAKVLEAKIDKNGVHSGLDQVLHMILLYIFVIFGLIWSLEPQFLYQK